MADKMVCAFCGKPMDRGQAHCPHCGAPAAKNVKLGGAPMPPPRAGARCPSCGAPVGEGDLICTRCGVNLLTGQKVAEAKPVPSPSLAPRREKTRLAPVLAAVTAFAALLLIFVIASLLMRDSVGRALKLARADKAGEAIDLLRDYLVKHTNDAKGHMLLGKLLWEERQYRQASDAFSAVADLEPSNAEAPLLAALALHKSKESDSLPREIEFLKACAARSPADAAAATLLGLAQGASKNYAAQGELFQALADAGNKELRRPEWAAAEALQGRLAEAKAILTMPQAEPTEASEAVLGAIAGMEGKDEEIVTRLEAALQKGADASGMLSSRLGALYLSQGEYAKALPLLEHAKSSPVKNETAEWLYAICLDGLGSDVAAIRACDAVAKGKGPHAGEAALQLATLYMSIGDLAKANESILLAAQLGNDSARLHTIRGRLRMLSGEADAAAEAFRMAIQKDPGYPAAHLEMGLMHLAQGVLTEGLREFERFLETGRAAGGGPAVNEVEMLAEQLKQTVQSQNS